MDEIVNKVGLTWHMVTVEVQPKESSGCSKKMKIQPRKQLLEGVTGWCLPGTLLTILGASDSGKSTLLSYIAGRLSPRGLKMSGDVQLNGVAISQIDDFSRIAAFIGTEETLLQNMTVKECLEFTAKLKLSESDSEQRRRVKDLISSLGLYACQEEMVGGGPQIAGLSKGERRRVAIAVELVSNPSLIFIDEPTAGLDPKSARVVTRVLRSLAKKGRSVIQTMSFPNL